MLGFELNGYQLENLLRGLRKIDGTWDLPNWEELDSAVAKTLREWRRENEDSSNPLAYREGSLTEYYLGDLLGVLKRIPATGDWWGELKALIAEAMDKFDIHELRNDAGDLFTIDTIGSLRPNKIGPITWNRWDGLMSEIESRMDNAEVLLDGALAKATLEAPSLLPLLERVKSSIENAREVVTGNR
jgi:hypothetical protein